MHNTLLFLGIFLLLFPAGLHAENSIDASKFRKARERMVADQIRDRGVSDPKVLDAMIRVPRHAFVPEKSASQAYVDHPLPIGEGQTISQPYIVALMTEALKLDEKDRVLEIGTGSGYQAAVLAEIAAEVYSVEIKENLHHKASRVLNSLRYDNVQTRHGDGYFGWPDAAPFNGIMITAAVDHVPPPLLQQIIDGGRLILPLGNPFRYQNLVLITRQGEDYVVKQITGVLFVPMTGRALDPKAKK